MGNEKRGTITIQVFSPRSSDLTNYRLVNVSLAPSELGWSKRFLMVMQAKDLFTSEPPFVEKVKRDEDYRGDDGAQPEEDLCK
jgi:hypothetical protein